MKNLFTLLTLVSFAAFFLLQDADAVANLSGAFTQRRKLQEAAGVTAAADGLSNSAGNVVCWGLHLQWCYDFDSGVKTMRTTTSAPKKATTMTSTTAPETTTTTPKTTTATKTAVGGGGGNGGSGGSGDGKSGETTTTTTSSTALSDGSGTTQPSDTSASATDAAGVSGGVIALAVAGGVAGLFLLAAGAGGIYYYTNNGANANSPGDVQYEDAPDVHNVTQTDHKQEITVDSSDWAETRV